MDVDLLAFRHGRHYIFKVETRHDRTAHLTMMGGSASDGFSSESDAKEYIQKKLSEGDDEFDSDMYILIQVGPRIEVKHTIKINES